MVAVLLFAGLLGRADDDAALLPEAEESRRRGYAALVAGDLPRAIAAFRRGLQVDPANARLLDALARSRDTVRYPPDADLARRLRPAATPWPPSLALRPLAPYALLLYCVGCMAFARWRMTRRPLWAWVAASAFALLAVPAAGSLGEVSARWRDADAPPLVVSRACELRAGNGVDYPAKLSGPLPRGCEVRRLYERGGWLQVEIADGTAGWLPADAAVGVRSP